MSAERGFTLVELMVVVAIMSVIAAIAVMRMNKSKIESEVDDWVNQFVQATNQARKRAINTRTVYLLDVRASQLQWCQVDPATVAADLTTTQTACPPATATIERGQIARARPGAAFIKFATSADAQLANATYTQPARTDFGGGSILMFFGPNGTVADTYQKAATTGAVVPGFTVYAEPTRGESNFKIQKRRRVVLLGASGRTRVIENWKD